MLHPPESASADGELSTSPPQRPSEAPAALFHAGPAGQTGIGLLSVVDAFAARTLSNLRAHELCVTTDKNGEGMKNPEAYLLCDKGKSSAKPPNAVLQTQDQFALTPDRQIRREREFRVPSTVSSRQRGRGTGR